jgi:hypothetical protein
MRTRPVTDALIPDSRGEKAAASKSVQEVSKHHTTLTLILIRKSLALRGRALQGWNLQPYDPKSKLGRDKVGTLCRELLGASPRAFS